MCIPVISVVPHSIPTSRNAFVAKQPGLPLVPAPYALRTRTNSFQPARNWFSVYFRTEFRINCITTVVDLCSSFPPILGVVGSLLLP